MIQPAGHGDLPGERRPPSCRAVEEPQRAHLHANGIGRKTAGYKVQVIFPQMLDPEVVGRSPVELTELRYRTDVCLLGARRQIAHRHVVDHALAQRRNRLGHRWLLSVGVHERAILADRTPPTDDPTPIGTANGPKGIYGRRSLSKPPKPTILDLSYRPHHKRLPRQRFSATGRYGIFSRGGHSGLMFAARITFAHFSVSSAMCFPKS